MSSSDSEEADLSSDEYEDLKVDKASKKRFKKISSEGSKKQKSSRFKSQFLDIAAESGDEEEESDIDSEFEHERREAERLYSSLPKRRNILAEEQPEDIARRFEDRATLKSMTDIPKDLAQVSQQRNLPSIQDPKLWLVGCRNGKEKEAAMNLMQKALFRAREEDPLEIFSAFASNHVRDYIYVEAYKKVHVITAIRGIHLLLEYKVSIVPIEEMVDVFSMDKAKKLAIEAGKFVRIKSGDYKGDIAQIVAVEEHRDRAQVKVVPRLEKTSNKKVRPPAKLFNPKDYPDCEMKRDVISRDIYYLWNGMQFRNGFLHKSMANRSLQVENVVPSLTEIQIFTTSGHEDENKTAQFQGRKVAYSQGDRVKVIRGDAKGLTGAVIANHEGMVTISAYDEDLVGQKLNFPENEVSKFFEVGDHVKVSGGRYAGITGMVAASKEATADLICDVTKEVISVLFNDLKLTDEISSGIKHTEAYKVHDIVTLNNDKAFGIVIKSDTDYVRAVMDNGDFRNIWYHEIAKRFIFRRASSIDRDGNSLVAGDMVKISYHRHELHDKIGSIKNSLRGILFLNIPDVVSSTTIVPIKASYCLLLGSERKEVARETTPRDAVGKWVRISKGPYRGHTGKLIKIMDHRAVVELNTKNKIITIDLEACDEVQSMANGMSIQSAQDILRTPAQSPGYAMQTPAHEIASPWGDTPRHDPFRADYTRSPSYGRR